MRRRKHERTSKRIAKLAAIGLVNPAKLTLDEIREVCGSALTQVEPRLQTKRTKRKARRKKRRQPRA